MAGKPSPKLLIDKRRLEVRRLLNDETREQDIALQLKRLGYKGVSQSTVSRDITVLQDQDREWIQGQAKGQFTTDYRRAIEGMREQIRQQQEIRQRALDAADETDRDAVKAMLLSEARQATVHIVEFEAVIVDLIAKGPAVFGVKPKDEGPPP